MLEHFTPDDEDDTGLHKLARFQALELADTDNDIDFTVEETRNAVASMDKKKAPGEDGITGEVYKIAFEVFPRYTGCPRRNVPDFRRVFLMLKYTDKTQNTYVQS